MNRVALVFVLGCALTIGYTVHAAEAPSPEYVKAMKALGGVMGTLSKDPENFEAGKTGAATAKDALQVVQTYWSKKNDAEAVKIVETAVKAVADLGIAASLSSGEGVAVAVKDLGATCATCHTAHREKTENGFLIK